MLARIAGALRTVLLIWTGLMFLPAWLVTIRGLFDGEAYSWGVTERIRGNGTGGYYFLAPLLAVYGLGLLALGWRGARRPFHLMLALWHIPVGVGASLAARNNREALRFKGDTLGIDASLTDVAPVVLGSVAAGSVALALIDRRADPRPAARPPNRRLLGAAIFALPLQFILLRAGKHHGTTDKIGVILTISQWVLLNIALAVRGVDPRPDYPERQRSVERGFSPA